MPSLDRSAKLADIGPAPVEFLSHPRSDIYIITRYGLGIGSEPKDAAPGDSGVSFAHDITLDANYESPTTYISAAVRGSIHPDNDYWLFLPTVAARLQVADAIGVLGRYFFSYNSLSATSHAVLVETDVMVTDKVRLTGGASGGLSIQSDKLEWEATGIGGIDVRINPQFTLSYQVEYLGRIGRVDGIRNVLVPDAAFWPGHP